MKVKGGNEAMLAAAWRRDQLPGANDGFGFCFRQKEARPDRMTKE
jgi:hypothetical protein